MRDVTQYFLNRLKNLGMRTLIGKQQIAAEDVFVSITVSIGGADKESMTHIETAIRHADEALYRAKEAGRNRTTFNPALATGQGAGSAPRAIPA